MNTVTSGSKEVCRPPNTLADNGSPPGIVKYEILGERLVIRIDPMLHRPSDHIDGSEQPGRSGFERFSS